MSAIVSIRLRLAPPAVRYHQLLQGAFPRLMSLERYLTHADIATLTAWYGEELVGVSLFREYVLDGERALLNMFSYICPDFRGQGLNGRFKGFVEQQARLQGIGLVVSHVRAGNRASIRSLERSGYRRSDCGGLRYVDGEEKLRMVKVLNAVKGAWEGSD